MIKSNELRQDGAASIIVVIFMSIILTIVTIGFLRIALNEQRTATDDDLTSRAFYAAESGIEDARRAIQETLAGTLDEATELNADVCDEPSPARYDPVLSTTAEFDIAYSCMLIDFTPNSIRSELNSANQTRQYAINPINPSGGTTNIGSITLQWHMDAPLGSDGDGSVASGGPVTLRGPADTTIPQEGTWTHPAMMQVNFINYPNSSFGRGDIVSSTSFISPGTGGGTTGNVFVGNSINPAVDGEILIADCVETNDNDFACSMEFRFNAFPASRKLEMRITNLYEPTTLEMTMRSPGAGGQALLFDDAQVVVDVTGRAGAVYRRVEAVLDLSTPNLLPEFAIQSASDICKDFSFTNNAADFGGVAGTSCTF